MKSFEVSALKPGTIIHVAAIGVAAFCLSACGMSPTTQEGMVLQSYDSPTKHQKTVKIEVRGGRSTDPMYLPQIANDTYQAALIDTINASRVFARVVQEKQADYLLQVTLISLDQPVIGGNFTVKMEAAWRLVRADTGEVVWRAPIQSSFTQTIGETFAAVTRIRQATEGAARNNIKEGLGLIAALRL